MAQSAPQYAWLGAEPVTSFLGPNVTQQETEVTAQAVKSGVIFVDRFLPVNFNSETDVADELNALAGRFDEWSNIPGVSEITTYQDITAQGQVKNVTVITVVSSSGKSSQTFDWVYPVAEFQTVAPLIEKVAGIVAHLDALEGA